MKKITLFLTALLASAWANGHNVWVEKSNAQYVVKFGHEETESYPAHKLKAVNLLNSEGKLQAAKTEFKQGEAYFAAPQTSIIFVDFDNGVWSNLPNGRWVEKTKAQEPSAKMSVNPVKVGKAILAWDQQAFKAHNVKYELVPQAMPKAGEPLDILVLAEGKPMQGIKVGLGEDFPANVTNEKGIAQFTPTQGYNKVWAEFEEKVAPNPDYDSRSIEYMLTFDVK